MSVDLDPLRKFFTDKIGGDASLLPKDDESLVDAGILDSFGLAELIAWIESTYGVKVPDRDLALENFASIDRTATYIAARLPTS